MIESTFKDKAFESFVMKAYQEDSREIFSVEYERQKYWVKKARATSSNFFHKLFYNLSRFDVLAPVESKSAQESLLYESNKLTEFNSNSIKVPKVIGRNEFFFVLENTGQNIYHIIKSKLKQNPIDSDEIYLLLNRVLELLANIHNNSFYHGGAQIRNFTLLDNEVYAIDLEDSFSKNISLDTLQFRDLLLFLLSLTKLVNKIELDFEELILKYIKLTQKNEILNDLKRLFGKVSFLSKVEKNSFVNKMTPNDFKGFIYLMNTIEKLESN